MFQKKLINYRPEIDGLRAIAVIAVILYHAKITLFKGGFIGVDIFFVISGYLITSIILKELVTTGTFSFKYFYERRVRRILPALVFVMLMSLPFAWMYLIPGAFIDFSKSILYSLGFSSNFYFHYSGQQYGAESGLLKPFLHTWSLSVEEQYYILFPVVTLIVFKHLKKYFGIFLIVSFVASLTIADWGSRNYPSATFYLLHSRMWELIAGSILAYFEIIRGKQISRYQILNSTCSILGLLFVIFAIIFGKEHFPHPSFYTLLPIIGVCLIIWFSSKEQIITKILSSKILVGVGLISYSLYLWHYPIFSLLRVSDNFPKDDIFKGVLIGIILILLSTFSYLFIEKPIRNKKYKFKYVLSFIIIIFSILVSTSLIIIKTDGYKKRLTEILQNIDSKKCDPNFENCFNLSKNVNKEICSDVNNCKFNRSSKKRIYIVGDSHAQGLILNLKNKVINRDYQFITSTRVGCFFFPGFNKIETNTKNINNFCHNGYFSELEEELKKNKNSVIIFIGRLPLYLNNYYFDNKEGGIEDDAIMAIDTKVGKEWKNKFVSTSEYKTVQESFRNAANELAKKNKIILIYPIPEAGWHVPRKILQQNPATFFSSTKKVDLKNITTSYQVYKERTKSSFKMLDSVRGKNVYRIYPHQLFCNTSIKDRCITHNDKNIFYIDEDHLSFKGVEMLNNLIIKEIDKINKLYN
jgi:peptidoglycan/LPS O-acetylase OafA/YrhL|tara:strand:+ start:366 stop:2450 length:2085 start_codon:yes stop_codon:yes gene_type:complete